MRASSITQRTISRYRLSPISEKPRILGLLLACCGILLLSACGTPQKQETPLIQAPSTIDSTYALHISNQVGRVERIIPDSPLLVIATRPELQSSRLTPGSRLECRSIQYEVTGIVEVGPNPSARYITAKIISGEPQSGDLVLLAPHIAPGVPQTVP